MKVFLLDTAGSLLLFGPLIIFMLLCVVLEALPMLLMKFASFGRSIFIATVANVLTLIAGFLVVPFIGDHVFGTDSGLNHMPQFFAELGMYYVITVIMEALVLKAFLKNKSWKKLFTLSIIMNLITYAVLVLMLIYFNN